MTGVAILGVTGSIGRSSLDVIRGLGNGYRVVGMSAGSQWQALVGPVKEFAPRRVGIADPRAADEFARSGALDGAELLSGPDASIRVASADDADVVVSAIVGAAGLEPTLAAVRAGKRVALANKEALVMGGSLLLDEARSSGAVLLPVDSEHSAIFQSALAGNRHEIRRIILTASGGPFRTRPANDFASITVEQALAHPTWSMGPKITVDSATLMNKALEVVEARWLFDVPADRIEVWIHPQSIVHSMVEFVDGSMIAQIGPPDMRLPIQYAITYPERRPGASKPLAVEDMARLTFERPDGARFPALELGYRAARSGGTAGAVLSAANEVAVGAFLDRRCAFAEIPRVVGRVMDEAPAAVRPTLEEIWAADRWARSRARELLGDDIRGGHTA
jgi:1-deoxy-D-xylulose-5-phosphate reductoisomerase